VSRPTAGGHDNPRKREVGQGHWKGNSASSRCSEPC
jgi:hypothetical protein